MAMATIFVLSALLWAFNWAASGNSVAFTLAALATTASLSGLTACLPSNFSSGGHDAIAKDMVSNRQSSAFIATLVRGAVITAIEGVLVAVLLTLTAGEGVLRLYIGVVAYCFFLGTATFALIKYFVTRH